MAFVVYSRRGCHLCEVLIEQLQEELARRDPAGIRDMEVRDIDGNPEWRARFDTRVPVLEHDGRWVSDYPLDRDAVRSLLAGPAA
ncbi:MAG: glutaredoxin family protein [Pseudomonadota bacterium]